MIRDAASMDSVARVRTHLRRRWMYYTAAAWLLFFCCALIALQLWAKHSANEAVRNACAHRVRMFSLTCSTELGNAGYTSLRQIDAPLSRALHDAASNMRVYGALYYIIHDETGYIVVSSNPAQEGSHTQNIGNTINPASVRTHYTTVTYADELMDVLDVEAPVYIGNAYAGSVRIGFLRNAVPGRHTAVFTGRKLLTATWICLAVAALISLAGIFFMARYAASCIVSVHNEMQEQNAAVMEKIGAGIAHEVKNALNGIQMNADLLQSRLSKYPDADSLEKKVKRISNEAARTGTMLTDFLTYTSPLRFSPKPMNLKAILHDIAQFFFPICREKKIEFTYSCADTLTNISADEQLLRHAVSNLLWNAIHVMEEKGGTLEMKAIRADDAAHISVRDTGGGMSAETEAKAFDVFYSTTPRGAGLGLSIVQRAIQIHNGNITLNNRPDDGCTFVIHIPLTPTPQ